MSDEQWKYGFEQLESRVEKAATNNEESWPPTYAEFVGLCKKRVDFAPGGIYRIFPPKPPESEEVIEKRKELAETYLTDLKSLF